MNAAWGGISEENQIAVCISAGHKTTKNITATGYFTVSMATEATAVACDYLGVVSGNQEPDKLQKAGLHPVRSSFVNAPILEELPMTLECRMIRYDPETCILLGEIVNVSADEGILDESGKIDAERLKPIIFDPVRNVYRSVGGAVADAFRAGLQLK